MPSKSVKDEEETRHTFGPGDVVKVLEGELMDLKGKVLSVDGNKITILPKHEDLKVGGVWYCQ